MAWMVRIFWGNRFAWIKVLIAVCAVTVLSRRADAVLTSRHPGIGAIRSNPKRHEGKRIWITRLRIQEVHPDGFTLKSGGIPIRVYAGGQWEKGQVVRLEAIVERGALRAVRAEAIPGYFWRRGLVYGVSLLLLLGLTVLFLRRMNLHRGVFVTKY